MACDAAGVIKLALATTSAHNPAKPVRNSRRLIAARLAAIEDIEKITSSALVSPMPVRVQKWRGSCRVGEIVSWN
jgi:hypothetical protein